VRILLISLLSLLAGSTGLRAAAPRLTATDGVISFGDGRRSYKSAFTFPAGTFEYSLFWRGPQTPCDPSLGFAPGTFGHFHHLRPATFWSPDGWQPYPSPSGLWLSTQPDGTTFAQITLQAFSQLTDNVHSSFTYRFCSLPQYPHWIFLRVSYQGAIPTLTFKSDAGWTDFVAPNTQGARRYLVLNGQHYLVNGPRPLPQDERFDRFALYSHHSQQLDGNLSILLFDASKAEFATLSAMPNSTLAVLFSIRLAAPRDPRDSFLTFALGNLPVDQPRATADAFMQGREAEEIRGVLRTIRWDDIVIDTSPAEAELRTATALIQETVKASDSDEHWLDSLTEQLVKPTQAAGEPPTSAAHSAALDANPLATNSTPDAAPPHDLPLELFIQEVAASLPAKRLATSPAAALALVASCEAAMHHALQTRNYDVYFARIAHLKRLNRTLTTRSIHAWIEAQTTASPTTPERSLP